MAFGIGPSDDYTDLDFDSLRERLRGLIRSAFPEWTDFEVASFGNLLVELFAHVGDVLAFYMENIALESRIDTARLRESLVGLSKLIGYKPKEASAATATLTLTLDAPPAADVTILAGDTFRTRDAQDPVVFQALADAVITAGASPPTVTFVVENSLSHSESFTSTGLPNQTVKLTQAPYLDASAVVSAADGAYTEVDSFLGSGPADRHYVVTVDAEGRARLQFGDGVRGAIPQGTISVAYKTGGGARGNVPANTITKADKSYLDALGNSVRVESVTNPTAASGGADRETVEEIRQNAPRSLRALERTVSREDFEIHAREVPGVARALMLTSNERAAIGENAGHLHIAPAGGGLPTTALKDAVLAKVRDEKPHTLTFRVEVRDPEYLTVDISATVFPADGVDAADLDARIRQALADFFALTLPDGSDNPKIGFGYYLRVPGGGEDGELALSDLMNVVRDVEGVRKLGDRAGDFLVNGKHEDLVVAVQEFPVLGTVTLLDGRTGKLLGT